MINERFRVKKRSKDRNPLFEMRGGFRIEANRGITYGIF
jgi:hypothetical protein